MSALSGAGGISARLTPWISKLSARFARSGRVFLIGLLVVCGIEVLVDWNATLYEINVLRESMRQRGTNYTSILTLASVEPMLAYDADAMDLLSTGLFEDEDVVYVRFADHQGITIYDRLRSSYGETFQNRRGNAFRSYYASQMDRDVRGILSDPDRLRQKIAQSHHRDFVQAWNDLVAATIAKFTKPAPAPRPSRGIALYQDRLRTTNEAHDADLSYALGTILDERNEPWGVVLVGFSMDRTNLAIRMKLLKGLGMVLFFVGLILVQNLLSRKSKLKLLDMEARQKDAKEKLREAMPKTISLPGWDLGGSVEQAQDQLDAMVWDANISDQFINILLVDPDGDGIDAAATSLHVLRTWRKWVESEQVSLLDTVGRLGEAALEIPLTKPIGIMIWRIDRHSGEAQAIAGPVGLPHKIMAGQEKVLSSEPLDFEAKGIIGPLVAFSTRIEEGSTLLALCGGDRGKNEKARKAAATSLCRYVVRATSKDTSANDLASDAATWARGKLSSLAARDLAVVLLHRNRKA